jgi:hypothetical protein
LIFSAKSQNAGVEKSTSGIQTGALGVWLHKEIKLSNPIALRVEIGMDAGIWGGTFYPKTGYLITPVITIEPRWYFNLNKRMSKSRKIAGNSGNFLTVQSSFHPNGLAISNYKDVEIVNQVSFIPTWGLKRNIGKHFTYETGIGIGYRYLFSKSAGYSRNYDEAALNLHLRFGYRFK